jgi:hypothetical protein
MPRPRTDAVALRAPGTMDFAESPAPGSEAAKALMDAWRQELDQVNYSALEKKSKNAYWATYKAYLEYMQLHGYAGKVCAVSIGMFLKAKCEAAKNSASFAIWRSHITHCARVSKNLEPFARKDVTFLHMLERACGKLFGEHHSQAPEWGADEVEAFAEAAAPDPSRDLKEYAIFVQSLVATNTMARPEDLAGEQCVVKAKHVTFLPASPKLPFGGFAIRLDNSKKQRKTGRKSDERLLGYGTGSALCPVHHLKRLFNIYGLAERPEDFLFAKLHKDGNRVRDAETSATTAISQPQYNSGLARLCEKAKVARVTARGSRAGGRTDLGAAGALDSVVTTLGRWSTQQAGRPYARQAERLLHHVVKTLGIQAPAADARPKRGRDAAREGEGPPLKKRRD